MQTLPARVYFRRHFFRVHNALARCHPVDRAGAYRLYAARTEPLGSTLDKQLKTEKTS